MIRVQIFIILLLINISLLRSQELIIQEGEIGFCAVDGSIMTSVTGYTGSGYADTDRGIGKSISWNVRAEAAGTYYLRWRYGNGGGTGDRPTKLLLNGLVVIDSVNFPHTGTWTNWTISDSVAINFIAGNNYIRLEAYSVDGLSNYDYIVVIGNGITPSEGVPFYILNVEANDGDAGAVSFEPIQHYYAAGTMITVRAEPKSGYFFQSWSGDETSAETVFSFPIQKNTALIAIFLPDGITMDPDLIGYATVQDDRGTPYLVSGGALGDTVEAHSVDDLQQYLGSSEPQVVLLSQQFIGTDLIKVSSNKTLLGIGANAHLQGIELQINGARNVIVKNMKINHVVAGDAIEITGQSQNVWIDHCELYSDRDHGEDYYDGLLDIKNESSFITISWCMFHDHEKTSLISSGDQAVADSVIRVTFHHNYFFNCTSRLPSIRFGKSHIFNNYYRDCDTAINSRMGACVRVEKNYFDSVRIAVMMEFSPEKGSVELIDNYFGNSGYSETPTCTLNVPYEYNSHLHEVSVLPLLLGGQSTAIDEDHDNMPLSFKLASFPNPFNPSTSVRFSIGRSADVTIKIFDVRGCEVAALINDQFDPGDYTIFWNAAHCASGLYFCQLRADSFTETMKIILLR